MCRNCGDTAFGPCICTLHAWRAFERELDLRERDRMINIALRDRSADYDRRNMAGVAEAEARLASLGVPEYCY